MCAISVIAFAPQVAAAPIAIEVALPTLDVDPAGDRNVFATPFDYRDGQLFTVHVEPPTAAGTNEVNLRTVVRHGRRQPDGSWDWRASVVEDRTIRDPYHTQASIALDRDGYVHLAYNMHNMPWQYSVSRYPLDISAFAFRGQPVTMAEIETVRFQNKTYFPTPGEAAIPGTQVTYPAFFKSPQGDLFVTYRYALKPARRWEQRAFAGGLARYDTSTQTWSQIGGRIEVSADDARLPAGETHANASPLIFEDGYSVYLASLGFDSQGGMHVFWNWRPSGAGMETISPSYAWSPDGWRFQRSDGAQYALPISFRDSDVIAPNDRANLYYAPKSVAVMPSGDPVVVLQPLTGGRFMRSFDRSAKRWRRAEVMPNAASEIVVDKQGRLWAFASGIKVFMRESLAAPWQAVGEIGTDLCYPRVRYYADESRFIVHAKTCDERQVIIVTFQR
jgi:hypothetical protein